MIVFSFIYKYNVIKVGVYMPNEETEKIITFMDTVHSVIEDLNEKFTFVLHKHFPNAPHYNSFQYYMEGSCVYFAEILHEVFKGYAKYCLREGHALVKIGDYYYDARGMDYDPMIHKEKYHVFEDDEIDEFMYLANLMRQRKEIDDVITPDMIMFGKEALAKIIDKKLQKENTLS